MIATKDRLAPLKRCLELALGQSRPPCEIVIVDASADWQANAEAVRAMVSPHPDVRLVIEPAPRPSSAAQRNLGIDRAGADILFMIDDDSFLHPGCAEEALKIYEADTEGAVGGVQLWPRAEPPGALPEAASLTYRDFDTVAGPSPWRRRLLRKLLVYGIEESFIPYEGRFPDRPLPASLKGLDVRPARLFEGFRMTFRRAALAEMRFDSSLLYYCPGEDLDLSHRVARTHCLVTAPRAQVHHFNSGDGRLKRRQVALLETLNQAVFLRRNAADQRAAKWRYRWLTCRKILAEFIKDLGQGRLSLPKTRGRARALWLSGGVFRWPAGEIDSRYPPLQRRIVTGQSG